MLAQEAHLIPFMPLILLGIVAGCGALALVRDRRKLLVALALLVPSTADAALIQFQPPVDPENYLEIQIEVTHLGFPRVFQIRDSENDDFEDWDSVNYSDVPNRIISPFWVPIEDAMFDMRPDNVQLEYCEVLVQEFITAGDDGVTMFLDPREHASDPWHIITFDSQNLGTVERTFERFSVLPEPRALIVLACGVAMVPVIARKKHICSAAKRWIG